MHSFLILADFWVDIKYDQLILEILKMQETKTWYFSNVYCLILATWQRQAMRQGTAEWESSAGIILYAVIL